MRRSVRVLAALSPFLVAGGALAAPPRPNLDAYHEEAPAPGVLGGVLDEAALPPAVVASRDAQRSIPTFLWAIQSGARSPVPLQAAARTPEDAARAHLAAHAPRYGLSPEALSTASVVRVLDVGRGGVVVVMRQSVGGIELFHSDVKVLMDRALGLVAIGGNLHAGAVPTPKTMGFVVSAAQAIAGALHDLYGASLAPADVVALRTQAAGHAGGDLRTPGYSYHALAPSEVVRSTAIHLTEPIRIKPVYFPLPGRIVPAYFLEIIAQTRIGDPSDAWAYVIAADDGRLLYREDLTHGDTFNFRVWADATGDLRPADGPLLHFNPHPTATPDGSYPGPAVAQLISIAPFNATMDPWLPAGAVQSQGNNVDAYTDDDAPEGFSPGDTRSLSTSASTFDHTEDLALGPQTSLEQREAAVTSMFYVNNWLHDWWYDSGFDEAGGNAQLDNYGRGGVAGDPLLAEGQFGAPTQRNGYDTVVPADGASPRMHMYVWNGVPHSSLILQPGNQSPAVGVATFGPQTFAGPTGVVVLADDGTAPDVNDGCEALVNGAAVSGNVALVNRGTCTFETKVVNAQAAGAVAVIIIDDKPNEVPPNMAADTTITTAVTIPVLSVSMTDGATLKGEIPGESATFSRSVDPDRDGTLDNTLVAHEWGHLLHLRNVQCGSQQCLAQSEGWGDFNALMMVVREGDDLGGTYALGQYVAASLPDDPAYFGIRRYPTSTDLTRSPLTFKYLTSGVTLPTTAPLAAANAGAANSEVHNAGELWASMVFEGYAAMLQQAQGASPPYTFDQARRRMSDYVVGGMAMAPTDPTYTEQRDALLAAAAAADPADLALLAQGFAKRGAGTCAVSPARYSTDFSGVVESFTVSSNLVVSAVSVDDSVTSCDGFNGYLDAGETGLVTVHVTNAGPVAIAGATVTVTSTTSGITFPLGATVSFGAVPSFTAAVGTTQIALASSFKGKQHLALTVTPDVASGCAAPFSVAPYLNVVEVPASSLVDDVEAKDTVWTTSGTLAAKIWSRVELTPGNHVWAGIDYGSRSDTSLVSPPLTVSATIPLVMNFEHAHSFESSTVGNDDGAVIEISSDGGATWSDISGYGDPGYGGMIGAATPTATNVLQGRQGYVATNASWPSTDAVAIDMGTKLAGATVQVRFRIGTDEANGAPGWQLDNLWFQGITNTPFTLLEADTATCGSSSSSGAGGGAGLGGSAGATSVSTPVGCGCGTAGDPGATFGGPLLALSALLLRRRRRAGWRAAG